VDDKASVRRLVLEYLTEEGFRVVTATNGREALFAARHEKPELILLDLMMPEMGGHEFMRAYTRESNTPIILLTAKIEESDKVLGLELGADDYVTKPFSMRELVARIRAVLRRADKAAPAAEVLRAAGITLDRGARQVTVGEQVVSLTPTEFDLLAILMAAPGRVFSRPELLTELQGIAFEGIERTVDVHVGRLRKKLGKYEAKIETVERVGYRYLPEHK
jgi:DNA-binding response OmpR family regulator